MDCYTKQRCPSCQMGNGQVAGGPLPRTDFAMMPSNGRRPDLNMTPRPNTAMPQQAGMRAEAPVAPPAGAASCRGNGGPGPARNPEIPMGPGPVIPEQNIDRFPVAMAYVPWQHWQQVYPVNRAMSRGTIFPDLDKPFTMGRCW